MKEFSLNDDARFDRLVDGELTEVERRTMLSSLDREPGGWRRCALAFLEAQCWQDSLRDPSKGRVADSDAPPPSHVIRAARPKSHWLVHVRTAMAMAACFMAALLIGSLLPRSGGVPTASAPSSTSSDATSQFASLPSGASTVAGQDAAGQSQPQAAPDGAWRLVTLSPSDRDGSAGVQVPAVERPNIDEAWLRSVPPAIPDDVLQALQRTGHEVQQQRQFVPVPMKDGRVLVVPIDQVDVHPGRHPAY